MIDPIMTLSDVISVLPVCIQFRAEAGQELHDKIRYICMYA